MADKHPAYSPANRPDTQEPEQLLREFHTVYNVPEGEDLSLYPGELPQLPAQALHAAQSDTDRGSGSVSDPAAGLYDRGLRYRFPDDRRLDAGAADL